MLIWIWVLLAVAVAAGIWLWSVQLRERDKAEDWRTAPEIHQGIQAGGLELGGLTEEEAADLLQRELSPEVAAQLLTLHIGEQTVSVTAGEVGISLDAPATAAEAHAIGRKGNYDTLLTELTRMAEQGEEVSLCYQADRASAAALAERLNESYAIPPINAAISVQDGQLQYAPDTPGSRIDEAAFAEQIAQAAAAGEWEACTVPLEAVAAEVQLAHFTPGMVLRARAETYFDGTDDARGRNIEKATALLDACLVRQGEGFSMNARIGDRTAENGWEPAPAIVDGGARREDQPGGGVCQVSSTLYNAVAKADLYITERRNHSAKVSYVKPGLDATINTGTIDFCWENNTAGDIYISARIEAGERVVVEVYGLPFEGFDEIRLTAEKTADLSPGGEMEVIQDSEKPVGYEEITVPRAKGSKYQSYKHYYAAGELIRTEKLHTSKYRAQNGEKIVGAG